MKKLFFLTTLLSSMNAFSEVQTVILEVPSMNCVTCPVTVKKSLTNVDGVKKAEVTYETKLAVVSHDDRKADIDTLISATTNAGYSSLLKE